MLPAEEQFEILKRGASEIVPEEGLLEKLRRSVATRRPLTVKLGLDPSAPDIHLGNAVPLRKLRQFQDLGHNVVVIIGDFTAIIGDPSGKSKTRPQLSAEEIAVNAKTYADQYCRILDEEKTQVVFNSQWLSKLSFEDVIRISAKFTMAQMLEREDFAERLRMGRELRMHEILYPLAQAYDSVALAADVEMGGIDQKFNILMGRELQREFGQEPQVGFFMPLLLGLDGREKMSKSLGNAIGITEPPDEMFGKVMSINDEMVRDYFILCTDIPEGEIERILRSHPMEAKRRLAWELVKTYNGAQAADAAQREFERVFSQRQLPTQMPKVAIRSGELDGGQIGILPLLRRCDLAPSNKEARRLIEGGAVELNGIRINDVHAKVNINSGDVLRVGKRRFVQLTVVEA